MRSRTVYTLAFLAAFAALSSLSAQIVMSPEFPLNAIPADSGRVRLEWSLATNVSITAFVVYRAPVSPTGTASNVLPFAPVDSLSGTSRSSYDSPPVPPEGGSYAYKVAAYLSTGGRVASSIAYVYLPPPGPPVTFRCSAALDASGIVQLKWLFPINTAVRMYYIHRYIVPNSTSPPDPRSATLIDSTTGTQYADPTSLHISGLFKYTIIAATADGKQIESNIASVQVGPVVNPPYIKLQAWFNPQSKPSLKWETSEGTPFEQFYVYRAIYNPLVMSPLPPPMVLIDSTTAKNYTDLNPPPSSMGYVYQVKGPVKGELIQSNPVVLVPQEHLNLRAYRDFTQGINILEWNSPYSVRPMFYVVQRQMLMDSTSRPDSLRWAVLDTVQSTVYKDTKMPLITVVYFGLAYRVTAILPDGMIPSNVAVVPMRPIGPPPFVLAGAPANNGAIALKWTDALPFRISTYYIFRGTVSITTNLLDSAKRFILIDSTTAHEYLDHPPVNLSPAFAYFVEARGVDGQAMRSNIVTVVPMPGPITDKVAIVSEPLRTARVGLAYQYGPKAVSSIASAQFRWMLGSHPSEMTIDSATGLVRWMPQLRGWYRVSISVQSSFGGRATQEYEIAVGTAHGVVEGSVVDSLGIPVPAVIKLFKRDASCAFEYSTRTDSTGTYRFPAIEVGSYLAYAAPLDLKYLPQWYFQANSPTTATPVLVAESSAVDVRFILFPRTIVRSYALAGMVTDTVGMPLPRAFVAFARTEFFLNSSKYLGSTTAQPELIRDLLQPVVSCGIPMTLTDNTDMVFRTLTDSAGMYSLRLPAGAYIGVAAAAGYRTVFYLNTFDPLTADVLVLSRDTTGIDFRLPLIPPVALGSISGRVIDTVNNSGVRARIIAFRDVPFDMNGRTDAFFAETDALGGYLVPNLPPGGYYVLVLPLGGYAPAFYTNGTPSIRWDRATKIMVNGNTVTGIDVFVRAFPQRVSGYTAIRGTIFSGAPVYGRLMKSESTLPLNGALVYALDADGSVAGYSISNVSGTYAVEGLAPGTYTITADRLGYAGGQTTTAMPSYDAKGTAVSASADLYVSPVVNDVTPPSAIPELFSLEQNFPNPFNPSTTLSYKLSVLSSVDLRVFDLLGREVAVLVNGAKTPGMYSVTWDAKGMASGIYFCSLRAGEFRETRRMILLK